MKQPTFSARPSDEDLRVLIARCQWRPSDPNGIYRDEPHEYICRQWSAECEELMVAVKAAIASRGYSRLYTPPASRRPQLELEIGPKTRKGQPYYQYYIDLDGYTYWAFWLVLNRVQK